MESWKPASSLQYPGIMRYIQFTHPHGRTFASVARFGGRLGGDGLENEFNWLAGSGRDQFPVDLYEDKDNTYVRAELPGVTRDAISVEIVDGSLSIQASRQPTAGEGEETENLRRLVTIPEEVQTDKVSAAYVDGILTVTLPRKEEAKPKKINVSVN
jgi:HSP20 family protein